MTQFTNMTPPGGAPTTRAFAVAFEFFTPAAKTTAPAIKALRDQFSKVMRKTPAPTTTAAQPATPGPRREASPSFRPLKRLRLPGLS